MAVPDEDVVREVLAKHDRDIRCRQAVKDAWGAVRRDYPNRAWYRRKSTSRALVWEHSVQMAADLLGDDPGIRVIPVNNTILFLFDDTVLLRFKKAGLQLRSSNYPTKSALLFHSDKSDKDLFGHEGHHRVEIAHVFDRFEIDLDWVGVVARKGRKVFWNFEIREGSAVVEPFPVAQKLPPAVDRVLRPASPEVDKSDENRHE